MAKWKLIHIVMLLLTSINSILDVKASRDRSYQLTLDYEEESTNSINTDTLKETLQKIKEDNMRCLYRAGINDESFKNCCGDNYQKIQDRYLAVYNKEEETLENNFQKDIYESCEFDKNPCEILLKKFESKKGKNRDLLDEMIIPKEEVEYQPGVLKDKLNKAFDNLEDKYRRYNSARILISQKMNDNVQEIKDLILKTGVKLKSDISTYEPEIQFTEPHIKNEAADEREPELTNSLNSFNDSILNEASARRKIDKYLSNGLIKEDEIDQGQLPSAQLDQAKSILRARKSTIVL